MYADAIHVERTGALVECVDWCGVRRTLPARRLAQAPSDRSPSDAVLLSLDLSELSRVVAREFFECFGLDTLPSELRQDVFSIDVGERRILVHPTSLITAIFENWGFWSRFVFQPHMLDMFYWSAPNDRFACALEESRNATETNTARFQQLAQWLLNYRSARRFASSLHWYALNERLMADLPQGELLLLVSAVDGDVASAITKARLLAILTDEAPDLPYSSVHRGHACGAAQFVTNSRFLGKVAEDYEHHLDERYPVSERCRTLLSASKPDQPSNWSQLIQRRSEASFASVRGSFGD